MDVDTIVNDSLSELETLDMSNKAVGMVAENKQPPLGAAKVNHLYCNSGICLMNLDFIKKYKINDKWINLLKT